MAGPVPPRGPAEVKAGLLDLAGYAVEHGWAARRAAAFLGLDHARYWHWAARRDAGRLEDAPPGGHPLHGLLAWEHAAIVELFEAWGGIDRSHRSSPTAVRGSAWCTSASPRCAGCWPKKAWSSTAAAA